LSAGKRKFLRTSIALFCVICFVVAWLAFGRHGFIHLYRVGKERQACEQRIKKLIEENQALFDEIQRLRTDPGYVEQVARKELGLVREDEIIYRFKNDKEPDTATNQGTRRRGKQDGNK